MASTLYKCPECGRTSTGWFGRCPNSECPSLAPDGSQFVEPIEVDADAAPKGRPKPKDVAPSKLQPFGQLISQTHERMSTGMPEIDRVLDSKGRAGAVRDSCIVLSGEPGAGKSTLTAEWALHAQVAKEKVFMVSGEESATQVKDRLDRIATKIPGARPADMIFSNDVSVERLCAAIAAEKPGLVIVDSIQTLISEQVTGLPGLVAQVRECTHQLVKAAKQNGTCVVLIGQVVKGGELAGPKTLEHMVDVTLQFENTRDDAAGARVLRAYKNRFSSNDEIGVMIMKEDGLEGVDPSEMFVTKREIAVPGTVTCVLMEGTRPLMCEIQALVNPNDKNPMPARGYVGVDQNRAKMMIAVLSRKLGLPLASADVYLQVTGGLRIDEPAADLAMCIALASALKKQPVVDKLCVFGEVNLVGEVQAVAGSDRRRKEAERLGWNPQPAFKTLREAVTSALSSDVVEEGLDGATDVIRG